MPDVRDFLCTAEVAGEVDGVDVSRGEVLIVREFADAADVALYLSPALETDKSKRAQELIYEGVSHFVFLVFRALHGESVSELELELQAEVDKYALDMLEGWGAGIVRARGMFRQHSAALRRSLYEGVEYIDAVGTVRGDRYRTANDAALHFTAALESEFIRAGDMRGFSRSLRRFYRRGLSEKLRLGGVA